METYKILRVYRDLPDKKDLIKTGLTLEEAQAHCSNPETSSSKCTSNEGIAREVMFGPWMDCYNEDTPKTKRNINNLKSPLSIYTDDAGWNF